MLRDSNLFVRSVVSKACLNFPKKHQMCDYYDATQDIGVSQL